MGFDFGSFAGGFAAKATEIEEESARIGMELINEAIEDFRVESKDWKNKYNEELRDWEDLAGYVKEMVGDDARAIAVLKKGKGFASDFIKTARQRADELGLDSPADLIEFGESTLPKNIAVEDWVRSGAPDLSLPAKPFLDSEQFKEFRTGVFGRQIAPEAEGRIQRTSEAYLKGMERPSTPSAIPDVDIDLYGTRQVPGTFTSTEEERYRKAVLASLASRSSAVGGVSFDVAGNPNYQIDNAEAIAQIERDADLIMDRIISMRGSAESLESAPTVNTARELAREFASSDKESIARRYDLGRGESEEQIEADPTVVDEVSEVAQEPAVTTINSSVINSQQYQDIVNPATTDKKTGGLKRRQDLVIYLTGIGISRDEALSHAQQVIPVNK